MKVFGTRRIRSTNETEPPLLLHASQRHANGQQLEAYTVAVRPHAANSEGYVAPRSRLILVARLGSQQSKYAEIEIRFTIEETRRLEHMLAQALSTRPIRKDAEKARPLTRIQARKRLIR
jgi:hypothetical protein